MNLQSLEKQTCKSFGCTKIRKDSKRAETNRNEVMQPKKFKKSRLVFPYHVHNQADFGNPFINGGGFI